MRRSRPACNRGRRSCQNNPTGPDSVDDDTVVDPVGAFRAVNGGPDIAPSLLRKIARDIQLSVDELCGFDRAGRRGDQE